MSAADEPQLIGAAKSHGFEVRVFANPGPVRAERQEAMKRLMDRVIEGAVAKTPREKKASA